MKLSDVIQSDDEHCDRRLRCLFVTLSETYNGWSIPVDICYHLIVGLLDMKLSRIQRKLFHFLIDSSILSFHSLLMSFQCTASDLSIHCTTVSCHYRSQSSSTVISTPPCHWRPAYQKQLDKDAFDRDWQEAGDEHWPQHTRPQRKKSEVSQDSFSSGLSFWHNNG